MVQHEVQGRVHCRYSRYQEYHHTAIGMNQLLFGGHDSTYQRITYGSTANPSINSAPVRQIVSIDRKSSATVVGTGSIPCQRLSRWNRFASDGLQTGAFWTKHGVFVFCSGSSNGVGSSRISNFCYCTKAVNPTNEGNPTLFIDLLYHPYRYMFEDL